MTKKILILSAIAVLLLSAILGYTYWKNIYAIGAVGTRIMEKIDESSAESCTIDLKTVTDFEWDSVVVVSADFLAAGYSDETVSEMFGFSYEMPEGFRSRMIFVKDEKIVHEESYAADIERSSQFNISLQHPYYVILTAVDCEIVAEESQGRYSLWLGK